MPARDGAGDGDVRCGAAAQRAARQAAAVRNGTEPRQPPQKNRAQRYGDVMGDEDAVSSEERSCASLKEERIKKKKEERRRDRRE